MFPVEGNEGRAGRAEELRQAWKYMKGPAMPWSPHGQFHENRDYLGLGNEEAGPRSRPSSKTVRCLLISRSATA